MNYAKKMMIALAAASVLGAGTAMLAQEDQAAPPPPSGQMGPGPGMHGGRMGEHDQLRRLTRELNLTPDQRTQVATILKATHEQMETMRGNTAMPPEQRHQQMRDMMRATHDQIRAVLNDDQKAKFDAMQARRQERMQQWRQNQGGGQMGGEAPAPPPAPQQ